MILNKTQIEEFEEAAKPLIKFLNDYCHPHCTIIVEQDRAELVEGLTMVKCEEFLKD